MLPPTGWNGPGWISGKTILKWFLLDSVWNLICDVITEDFLELGSIIASISVGSFVDIAERYACKSLCVLWTQGRPALSVHSDQIVEVAKNKYVISVQFNPLHDPENNFTKI